MTIQVRSNETPQPEVKSEAVIKEDAKSAHDAEEASEQNESTESDPEETEAEEESKDESEDEEDSDEESDESKDDAKDKPKKKSGFRRRIDKLNARYAEERQRREALEQRLAHLERAGDTKPDKVETKADESGKPDPEQFESHVEYVEALTDWKLEQREKANKQEQEKSKLLTEHEKVLKAHSERVKSFAEKTEDFSEVLESVDDVPVSSAFQELIVSSENGPSLMYELAKNREEFERIAQLSPLAAAREIGRIEARLSKASEEKKPEPKKLTKAPKPLEPVGTGGKGGVRKSLDDPSLSQAEYERIRADQIKRRQA